LTISFVYDTVDPRRIKPNILYAYENKLAVATCNSSQGVQWHNNTYALVSYSEQLRINNIRVEDGGIYTCLGVTETGHTFRSRIVLNVVGVLLWHSL